jgi:hypothetical protein
LLSLAFNGSAQTSSSISGTVKDRMGSVIPGAKVVLTNQANKATSSMKSNGEGFFFFSGVQVATYSVEISSPGFETWKVTGLTVHPGDDLSIPKINLQPGAVTESVTVTAEVAGVSLNTGEHSTLITAAQISRLSTVGRDANELISMLPGFSVINGGLDNVGADYQTTGPGSGNLSSFSANGSAPQQGLVNVTSDGANLIDPGDMGGQLANINMDQVQEVKVQTSNFGADEAKGPIVINAVGKSGGSEYHGSLYTYYRNFNLNANEWVSKKDGASRPETKYLYPGGSFGGPVKFPGTQFNRSKRLVFWVGYEYYGQDTWDPSGGLQRAFVPNAAMMGGDLSYQTLAHALNVPTNADSTPANPIDPSTTIETNCSNPSVSAQTWLNIAGFCVEPNGTYDIADNPITNGQIKNFDPGMATYTQFWPAINHIPQPVIGPSGTTSQSEGFNYVHNNIGTANGFQLHSRVDENISDSLKFYATYNWEKTNYSNTEGSSYLYNVSNNVPQPTAFNSNTGSQYLTLDLLKTVNVSTTNELTATGAYFVEPAQYADRSKVLDTGTAWANAGYSGGMLPSILYGASTTKAKNNENQLPIMAGWESINTPGFAAAYVPAGKGQFINKFSWNLTDNLTKVYRTHSIKAGFYAEQTANNSMNLGSMYNGEAHFMRWGSCYWNQPAGSPTPSGTTTDKVGTNNEFGQFLEGCPLNFSQDLSDYNSNMIFTTIEGFVNDEWKVNSKLTVTLGIRLSHLTPWTDRHDVGVAVWEPSLLTLHQGLSSLTSDPKTWTGFSWHQKDPSIPLAGVPTRAMFYSPRFSVAYDLFGNGKTVLRGGWGAYHSHDAVSYAAGAGTALGAANWNENGFGTQCSFAQMFTTSVVPCGNYGSGTSQQMAPFSVSANDPHDNRMPVTYNYNFTVDQHAPWKMQLQVAYVGNQSSSLSTLGSLQNQNVIPIGAFYGPDPCMGTVGDGCTGAYGQVNSILNISGNLPNDYRPYPNYAQINVPNHVAWANYNGLQASLNKQAGSFIFGANYTFSKTLAVRGNWDTGGIGDPINMSHDYGITSFNRPYVINGNYSWQEGSKFHGNRIMTGALNGWEVSGVITLQAGPDLPVMSGNNFGLGGTVTYYTPGTGGHEQTNSVGVGSNTWLGTSDYSLQPIVTCSPSSGLSKGQFVNGNCFGLPPQGTNGVYNLPYTAGPKYFKWDMSIYKDFKISDRQNIQFRGSGFNFLNHPITSFSGLDPSNPLNLQVGDASTSHYTSLQDALNGAKIVNPTIFGGTLYKRGQRIVELGFKYNF